MESKEYIDHFGFPNKWDHQTILKFCRQILPRKNKLNQEWNEYIESINGIENIKKCDKLKKLVKKGIPDNLRPFVWLRITEVDQWISKNPRLYRICRSFPQIVQKKHLDLIKKDVPRTSGNQKAYKQEELENVLIAFCVYKPDIGYCQGMSAIVGILLPILGEENSFYLFSKIMSDFLPQNYFTADMKDAIIDIKILEGLIQKHLPTLYNHSKSLNFDWHEFVINSILTLFVNVFPPFIVFRIWDYFFYENQEIIFRVPIAFLRMHEQELLQQKDVINFLDKIRQFQKILIDDDLLMNTSFKIGGISLERIQELRMKTSSVL